MAMRSISQILVLAVVLLPLRTYIDAAVPQLINYQGSLTDTNGAPLPDTTINIIFSIYRNDSIVAWTSGPQPVEVTNGTFDYVLGSSVPLPDGIISPAFSRFLGIQVGDDPEMVPWTQLISVPYAYKVGSIHGAAGGTVEGNLDLTADLSSQNSDFAVFYPSTIEFQSSNSGADNFIIGSQFNFDADQGVLRLGTDVDGYQFPSTDGAAGEVLETDGSGQLSWEPPPGGTGIVPIGSIIAWAQNLAGVPPLPSNYKICDGSDVSDSTSPLDGINLPDLISIPASQRFLRGSPTSGFAGGSDSHNHLIQSGADQKGPGSSPDVTSFTTGTTTTLPTYYEVVWIMRIK